jgi:hypothetical protein
MIEITIYVQDRERKVNPKQYSTRVFLPNNYRSIGICNSKLDENLDIDHG